MSDNTFNLALQEDYRVRVSNDTILRARSHSRSYMQSELLAQMAMRGQSIYTSGTTSHDDTVTSTGLGIMAQIEQANISTYGPLDEGRLVSFIDQLSDDQSDRILNYNITGPIVDQLMGKRKIDNTIKRKLSER